MQVAIDCHQQTDTLRIGEVLLTQTLNNMLEKGGINFGQVMNDFGFLLDSLSLLSLSSSR